jgi:hypothetical protein
MTVENRSTPQFTFLDNSFRITFENGFTLSAINKKIAYCEDAGNTNTKNVEVYIQKENDTTLFFDSDDVKGFVTPSEFASLLFLLSNAPKDTTKYELGLTYKLIKVS